MQGHLPSSDFQPRRILVRGVNWLGDAVMTTPALLRLRERFPRAHIAMLAPEKLADLWLHHPAIDEIIPFGTGESVWKVASRIKHQAVAMPFDEIQQRAAQVGQRLRTGDWIGAMDSAKRGLSPAKPAGRGGFDLALVLPNSPRSAFEVWLARVPHRIGYARPWRNWSLTRLVQERPGAVAMRKLSDAEIKRRIVLHANTPHPTHTPALVPSVQYSAGAHHIHQYLHLTAALGANPEPLPPQLFVTPIELAAVEKKFSLDEKTTSGHPLLALNAGAEYGPAKRWPVERFIAAAQEIQKRVSCVWLITGNKADAPLAAKIQSAIGHQPSAVLNLAGQTSLRELMSVLKLCRVLLTNDTGPMHVAAAVGTPVVVPFGSTSPELTGPALPDDAHHRLLKANAPCSPCFRRTCPIDFRCMQDITEAQVVQAVVEVLQAGGLKSLPDR